MRFLLLLINLVYLTSLTYAEPEVEEHKEDKDALSLKNVNKILDELSQKIDDLTSGQMELQRRIEEIRTSDSYNHNNEFETSSLKDQCKEVCQDLNGIVDADPIHKVLKKRDVSSKAKGPTSASGERKPTLQESFRETLDELKAGQTAILSHLLEYRKEFKARHDIQESMLRRSFSYGHEWITILSRTHYGSSNVSWHNYKHGHSNVGFYFLGLESLYLRTNYDSAHELMIIFHDWNNQTRYAKYDLFQIGDEDEQYALRKLGKYMGNAGDSLSPHLYKKFSTYDRDNDENDEVNCAQTYGGGWWFFGNCTTSMLTGPYRYEEDSNMWGVSWSSWRGWNYSLKSVEMLIRPTL
ncbi:fibrinogen-like protein 1 [Musca autumnalis]|uniref:fibrinogen-like protein 1 n=1 Tax=Musca autumnalis TaxID=221902 RepID=UPI003CE7F306